MIDRQEEIIREPLGLFGWFYEAFRFVGIWLVTRSLWMFLRGLPALVVFIAIPVLALSGRTTANRESLKRTYLKAAIDAAQQEDFDAAILWNRKLLSLDTADREARFRLALATEAAGDVERGREILSLLTPADGTGFVPAHFYLASKALQESDKATPEVLRSAVWNLNKVLEQEPDNMQARDLMVRLQIRRGDLQDAAFHLSKMVSQHPELHLMLAGIYQQLAMADAAAVQANQARVHFRGLRNKNPDNLQPLLRLAEAHAITHDFETAEQLLAEHLAKGLDTEEVKIALLKLALIEIDVELKKAQPRWQRLIVLLERSLGAFPAQELIFARVALVAGRFQGAEADQLRTMLEDALADGRAPAVCHLLLGTMLGQSGKLEEGIGHLRAALQVFPENPVVLNNLAWYLTQTDPPALEEALELAELAFQKAPRVLEIRETRGQILAKLQRPQDALPDLEAALQMRIVDATLHQTLAEVYKQLGNPDMAARHQQRAAELAK
ncbi:MAG: hypothetical protein AB7U20_06210 [Planctomycetaceae bacterium]